LLTKLFTLGNKFSLKDFIDRLKKYAVEGIGIFIVISFSFYVENKGTEYEMTKSYLEMLFAFKKDIIETKEYSIDFRDNLKEEVEAYENQLARWNVQNDSIFISSFEDKDGKYFYPPLAYFNNYNPFIPSKRGYSIFKLGGVDFELLNNSISEEINEFYEKTLFYLIENSTDYEKKYIQDFEERIINNWSNDIDVSNLMENDFWIKNRRYIQNDKSMLALIKFRLNLWSEELDQMDEILDGIQVTLDNLNDIIQEMEDDYYFIYWRIN
jgi:hypothetical protein